MLNTIALNNIINGDTEKSIAELQRYILAATQYITNPDDIYDDGYLNNISNLISILIYLKESDSTLLGLWKKRTTQIRGYQTALEFTDSNSNNDQLILDKLKKNIPLLVANVPNISAFGDILFYVDIETKKTKLLDGKENLESSIIVKKVEPIYYVRDKTGDDFQFIPNTSWTNNYDTDKNKYIYIRDELFFIGGIMRGLAIYSLAKQSNLNSWFNGNNRLFSALIAYYDSEKMLRFIQDLRFDEGTKDNKELFKESIESVYDSMDKLYRLGKANVPDAIKFEQKSLVDSSIGASYKEFISTIDTMFEVAILGQSGTTRNDSTGSFAKAQTMNLTTEDIKWTDINYSEDLVNMYISKALPLLSNSIKPENIKFNFIQDETKDTLAFAQIVNQIANVPMKTNEGKVFAMPVKELFGGLGMSANTDYYGDDEMMELGDNAGEFYANEVNKIIYENNMIEEE
jgi:hypothetical protein